VDNKVGIIVDGPGDFAALSERFKDNFKILKTDGPRGHMAKIDEIVAKSRKQIAILKAFKCKRAIVLFDFENRSADYCDFLDKAQKAFQSHDFRMPVFVASPNRMMENWYLADIEYLSRKRIFLKNKIKQKNFEGTHGKTELKKCFIKRIDYSETQHGPQLFSILRFNIAKKNSDSFNRFVSLLYQHMQAG
jgi:hypothetical protein